MPDLDTLHEAFAELERRTDAAARSARLAPAAGSARHPAPAHRPPRLLLAAAAAVVVGGVAVGSVAVADALLAGGHGQDRPAGGPASTVAGPRSSAPVTGAPSSAPLTRPATPSRTAPGVPGAPATPRVSSAPRPSATSPSRGAGTGLPGTAAALAARLHTVLGRTATFTWSAPAGAGAPVIGGTLTDAATHRRGGFDLQVVPGRPGDDPICEDADVSHCVTRSLPSGARVSIGHETQGRATVYLVDLVRKDGSGLLMHVGNQRNPKGAGAVLSPTPPLSRDRIVAVLDSPRW